MIVAYSPGLGSRWMALPADLRGSRRQQDLGSFWAAYGPRRFQAVCVSAGHSVALDSGVFDRVFGKAPPAGFEPAHTAPECTALHASYLQKRHFHGRLGRVWAARASQRRFWQTRGAPDRAR